MKCEQFRGRFELTLLGCRVRFKTSCRLRGFELEVALKRHLSMKHHKKEAFRILTLSALLSGIACMWSGEKAFSQTRIECDANSKSLDAEHLADTGSLSLWPNAGRNSYQEWILR